jgi:protein gp37
MGSGQGIVIDHVARQGYYLYRCSHLPPHREDPPQWPGEEGGVVRTRIPWVVDERGRRGFAWNPVTGCSPASEGCERCYARRSARRLAGRFGYPQGDPFAVTLHHDLLTAPMARARGTTIFVCSMGDLLHPQVPTEFVSEVWCTMAKCQQHRFVVLTKRPDRLVREWEAITSGLVLPNVVVGVSCENQARADERIPWLLRMKEPLLAVSLEPLLGRIDFLDVRYQGLVTIDALRGFCRGPLDVVPPGLCRRLHWVIAGAESGEGGRPGRACSDEWLEGIADQCEAAGVPFFLKQRHIDGELVHTRELGGRIWRQVPWVTAEEGESREVEESGRPDEGD